MASIWSAARKLSHSGDMPRSTKSSSTPPEDRQRSGLLAAERGAAADATSSPPPSPRATGDTVGRSRIMLSLAKRTPPRQRNAFCRRLFRRRANFAQGARGMPEDKAFPLPSGLPHSLLRAQPFRRTKIAMPADKPTVTSLAASLAAGRTSSRALVEEALARIADPSGEGRRCFLRVYADNARKAADAQDQLRAAGYVASPLAGLPVSIKDLFDVAGERTLAGSKALDDRPPAARDAPVVARLRAAGAVLIGRTHMTEFALSGVGINPHYGTPGNPFDRQRIPGGSSSGAPISVIDGFAVLAIGTDTGGSVRIPAAPFGTVGLKPTQKRMARDGAVPPSIPL